MADQLSNEDIAKIEATLAELDTNPNVFELWCGDCNGWHVGPDIVPQRGDREQCKCEVPARIFVGEHPDDNDAWFAAGIMLDFVDKCRSLVANLKAVRAELAEEEKEHSIAMKAVEDLMTGHDELTAALHDAKVESESARSLYGDLKRTVDAMVVARRGAPREGEYPGTCAQLEILLAELDATKAKLAEYETKAAKRLAELEDMKAKMSVARAAIEAREKAPGLKVWRATVSKETDIYVLARTKRDAQSIAEDHADDELRNVLDECVSDPELVDPSRPPFGGGIPWSNEEDNLDEKEVDELLAEQLEREKEAEAQRIADLNQLKLFTDEVKP